MKEKVMLLAQGKFTYEQPEIVLSEERLEFEVAEGGEASAVFHVKNGANTRIKGFSAVDEFDIDFLPVFDGKDNEVIVRAHAGVRKAGDVMSGDIYVITDCGEKTLPYRITVTGRYLEGTEGPITSYQEFVRYAEEQFDKAVKVFYHEKFRKYYLSELGEKRLYQYLTRKNPKKQALEEFLVAHGDKKPVHFMVNKKQIVLDLTDEDVTGEIMVVRDSWGMIGIRLSSDRAFLSLDQEYLREDDFEDNKAVLSFRISAGEVPPGIHRCRIVLDAVCQQLEVAVHVHCRRGAEEREERLAQKKLVAGLIHCHIRHMLNSSVRESWLRMLEENRTMLSRMFAEDEFLLNGYMSYLAGNKVGTEAFKKAAEEIHTPKIGEELEKIQTYLVCLYLKAKMDGSQEDKEDAIVRTRTFYANGYHHWTLLVLLERLGFYEGNEEGLLEELDSLWEEGYASPYMHLYRSMIILQDVDQLHRLDSQTTGALLFSLKHGLMTEDIVMSLSLMAGRSKHCAPALLKLLERCYDMFGNQDTLHSICSLLIRSERQAARYFKWFQLGVEQSLRITELFEYYMYTMEKQQYDAVLSTVISYFKYENHLRDSVKAQLYASIVRNKEEHPEYFQVYREVIWKFVLAQLSAHRINKELSVLYEAFLDTDNVKDQVAKELPYILFAYRVHCANKNMERVVVVHDEGGGEMRYNLTNGEACIHIGTPHFTLYFEDKSGFFHANTVSYELEKILNLDLLSENCYENGSEHPVLLLHLFARVLGKDELNAQEAIFLHTMVRSDMPGVEYRSKALLVLYEYYRSIGEETLLEEIISQVDFDYLDDEKRAGILQTMIQHKLNDEALATFRKYRIINCSKKLVLLLATWKLEEKEEDFDPYYMRLCDFLYRGGASNPTTLSYLTNYYMGSTGHLHEIYRDAKQSGAEIHDGGMERLLGQALFVSDNPEAYADLFLDYYEYGANRVLVKAFLSYTAYEYIVGRCEISGGILDKIRKEGLSEDHHTMVLAMLKYYSGQETFTDAEKEYIGHHLSQYASKGKIFDFMKRFAGRLEVPFEIAHAQVVQFYSSHKGGVYIKLGDGEDDNDRWPMKRIFTDIYAYEVLLFRGERIPYRIYAGDMQTWVKEGELTGEDVAEPGELAFYELVNGMVQARESEDRKSFDALVEQYKCRRQIADKLFAPL